MVMMLMPVLLNLLLRIFLLKCGEKPLDSSMGCFSKDNLIHSSESNETSDSTETPSSAQSEKKNGSSAKSVGGRWLFKSTKLVIERYLQAVQCFKAVCLFDSEFCLVI